MERSFSEESESYKTSLCSSLMQKYYRIISLTYLLFNCSITFLWLLIMLTFNPLGITATYRSFVSIKVHISAVLWTNFGCNSVLNYIFADTKPELNNYFWPLALPKREKF